MKEPRSHFWLTFVMPIIHLFLCVVVERGGIEAGFILMVCIDFPIGLFLGGLAFRDGYFLFWFGVFGTLWWYLVSWAAWATSQLLGERRRTAEVKAGQDADAKPGASGNKAEG
jgi:hypothetical protein